MGVAGDIAVLLAAVLGGLAIFLSDRAIERKDKEIARLTNLLIARNPAEARTLDPEVPLRDYKSEGGERPKIPRIPID